MLEETANDADGEDDMALKGKIPKEEKKYFNGILIKSFCILKFFHSQINNVTRSRDDKRCDKISRRLILTFFAIPLYLYAFILM